MNARLVHMLLLICGLAFVGSSSAQQQIGNNVWICDGAAHAGPCGSQDEEQYEGPARTEGYSDNDYVRSESQWADRWGAVASNGEGVFGIVDTQPSKAAAENEAVKACWNRGGGGACKIRHAYHNQCVSVAANRLGSNTVSAVTKKKAEQLALKDCNAKYGSGQCHVYYSGCSLPQRIQ